MDPDTVAPGLQDDNLPSLASLADLYEEPAAHPGAEQVGREVFELFETGLSRKLMFPKIRLRTDGGQTVILRRAGDRSRYKGQILITDGRPYPATYFGRIDLDGVLRPSRAMTVQVSETLSRFAADPIGEARRYAWANGNCSYCGKRLTDVRSAAHGRGKRCSENYGLAWNADRGLRGFWQDWIDEIAPMPRAAA